MLLVVLAVAVISVLSFAMLSAASLDAVSSGSARTSAASSYLAESGVQAAIYYLENPSLAPTLNSDGYYPGHTIRFGSAVPGQAEVTVTRTAAHHYTIVSTGRLDNAAATGAPVRRITAEVKVSPPWSVNAAAQFQQSVTLNSNATITGNCATDQTLTVGLMTRIAGTAIYRLKVGTGIIDSILVLLTGQNLTLPTPSAVRPYTGAYKYQGKTYYAQKLATSTLSNVTLPTAADALVNPAGIYWTDTDVSLTGYATINGTLRAVGSAKILVSGSSNVVRPQPGFPAIVSDTEVRLMATGTQLTAEGLVYLGDGIHASGMGGSVITINGSLMTLGSRSVDSNYTGSLRVTYDAAKADVPNFLKGYGDGVAVLNWSEE